MSARHPATRYSAPRPRCRARLPARPPPERRAARLLWSWCHAFLGGAAPGAALRSSLVSAKVTMLTLPQVIIVSTEQPEYPEQVELDRASERAAEEGGQNTDPGPIAGLDETEQQRPKQRRPRE